MVLSDCCSQLQVVLWQPLLSKVRFKLPFLGWLYSRTEDGGSSSGQTQNCPRFLFRVALPWWLSWMDTQSKQLVPPTSASYLEEDTQGTPVWCSVESWSMTELSLEASKRQAYWEGRQSEKKRLVSYTFSPFVHYLASGRVPSTPTSA